MSKYIQKFDSIASALASTNSYSPNVAFVNGANNPSGVVYTDCGDNKYIEFWKNSDDTIEAHEPFHFVALEDNCQIALVKVGNPSFLPTLKYSRDFITWYDYEIGVSIIINTNEKLYFKGQNSNFSEDFYANYVKFESTKDVNCNGTVMSLVQNDTKLNSLPANNVFAGLFANCTHLKTPPELPSQTLKQYCYYWMFRNCTGLTTTPKLLATTLTTCCYCSMFDGCTGLTTAPKLPATTLVYNCYTNMFGGCSNLKSIDVNFTDWGTSSSTSSWMNDVSGSGFTFTKPTALPATEGVSYIPSGATIINK